MASGKISVFATTNETSLPITLTKIKKERPEMAVMVFSLRAFRELPSLSATDQRQLFSLGYLYLPAASGGHMLLVGPRTEVV